ncbi:mitochondrial AAA ATPase [Cladophialophora carrionii]|uniref:Mitochondrial AAA ATPase n=1 Tax=Cladophialophora carrionii TaxID=86049 RepID=A0A1C1C6X5_9EURO|nr:mitochondrial AAA ATPase [Cladophialophora carrionii]
MKTTLQAELRFSQIICATCRHCAQRQPRNTRRSFHTAPRPRTAPRTLNVGSLASRGISDDAKSHGAPRSDIVKEDADDDQDQPSHLTHKPPAPTLPQPADVARSRDFYGSPAKRRLRSRMNREPETDLQAPEWWKDNNISLWGVDILPGAPSKVHTVAADLITGEPLEQNFSPDTGGSSPSGNNGEDGSTGAVQGVEGARSPTETTSEMEGTSTSAGSDSNHVSPSRYYVVDEQYDEVLRTARGLLQMSQNQNPNGVESYRDHLHLQYAGKDGDLLLDHLVQDVARNLGCDVMVIDAQDIADLISRNHMNQSTAKAGRMLSYDVLTTAFPDPSESAKQEQLDEDDDENDLEDMIDDMESPPTSPRMGMSILTARPGDIIKSLVGRFPDMGESTRAEGQGSMFRMVPDFLDPQKTRDEAGALSGVIYKMLKTISDRPSSQSPASSDEQTLDLKRLREKTEEQSGVPQGAVIVHIRDYKAIQDTVGIGRSFLTNMQKQLAQRRAKGERLLLIGTDSARDDQEPFTKERIHESQAGWLERKSQNIIITPVLPNTTSKLALLHDRKQRIAAINMRHLWEMLRFWKPSVFAHFEPGFWRRDFSHLLTPSDRACLEAQVWTYQYVQRLASYIAGDAPTETNRAADAPPIPIISAATSHLKHSDNTKIRWAEKQSKESRKEVPERHMTRDNRLAKIRASASKYEKRLLSGIIEAKNITTTFNDVHMPVETIDALQTLTTLSLTRPDAFKYGVLASNKIPGLLLYGPPGTGKTLAAKAVAKESGATMLEVSAADLNDMYVGESEKNVRALFSLARKLSPCVVFLDEADAMFRARSNQGPRVSHREQLNQFLKEWDGMSNDSASAFIMVATNRPHDLDDAVLRRLPRRLLVDLPTEADRLEILKIHLRHETVADDVNLEELAKKTPFYSGSDLKNVAVAAALNAVREENELARKHEGQEPYQHPERRTLTKSHFDRALGEISASISEDMSSLRDIKKFDEQYGDKRGKKKKVPRLGFPVDKEDRKNKDTVKVRD